MKRGRNGNGDHAMKRRRSNDPYTMNDLSILNEIDPGINLIDSYNRMKENEVHVQAIMGTPSHRLYNILASHESWYVEGSEGRIFVDLPNTDDRMLELGFTYEAGYHATGPDSLNVILDIYRLRNHYHTRGMFLLPRDPNENNNYIAVSSGYGYIQ